MRQRYPRPAGACTLFGVAKRRYSELECFTLGLVWQFGPCSPYDVRRHMKNSPSTRLSASTGAIYPMIRRLQRWGLVSSRADKAGKRPRRLYAITPAGLKVLRAWITPPFADEVVTVSHDPLRSRARFLGAVDEEARARWVDAAAALLDEVGRRVARWQEIYAGKDAFAALVTRHGELDTQARRAWVEELRGVIPSKPARG